MSEIPKFEISEQDRIEFYYSNKSEICKKFILRLRMNPVLFNRINAFCIDNKNVMIPPGVTKVPAIIVKNNIARSAQLYQGSEAFTWLQNSKLQNNDSRQNQSNGRQMPDFTSMIPMQQQKTSTGYIPFDPEANRDKLSGNFASFNKTGSNYEGIDKANISYFGQNMQSNNPSVIVPNKSVDRKSQKQEELDKQLKELQAARDKDVQFIQRV